MSFTNPFGGSTLQATEVAYRAVSLTASVTLVWPYDSVTSTDCVARLMDVTASGSGYSITLPPANAVSTGYDFFINNVGANTFTVLANDGTQILSVAAGQRFYVYLTSNASAGGAWNSFQLGVGSANLQAAQLAGAGLAASGALLVTNNAVVTKSASYAVQVTDRALVLIWTGGAGTLTLLSAATATGGFYFAFRNVGTGTVTVNPTGADTVDGVSSITIQPGDSAIFQTDGASAWYTVGRGRNVSFAFTRITKTVTGGTLTLSQTEAANVVQIYNGALTSNQTVNLPPVVQVYYVSNQTSGAFTLTFQVSGGGTTYTLPQGYNAILFCDGTNVINADTTALGGSISLTALTVTGNVSIGGTLGVTGASAYSGAATFNNTATFNAAVNVSAASTMAVAGTITVPTQAAADNSTKAASTAMVQAAIAAAGFGGLANAQRVARRAALAFFGMR